MQHTQYVKQLLAERERMCRALPDFAPALIYVLRKAESAIHFRLPPDGHIVSVPGAALTHGVISREIRLPFDTVTFEWQISKTCQLVEDSDIQVHSVVTICWEEHAISAARGIQLGNFLCLWCFVKSSMPNGRAVWGPLSRTIALGYLADDDPLVQELDSPFMGLYQWNLDSDVPRFVEMDDSCSSTSGELGALDALLLLNSEGVEYTPEKRQCTGKTTSRSAKKKNKGKREYHEIVITGFKPASSGDSNDTAGTHASPRLHLRRGHWRRKWKAGGRTWVKAHLVGDASLGEIEGFYRIKNEEAP